MENPSVWLVTGVMASGKSTVAEALARTFPRAVHVRGGQFYRWAVTGWVHPGDTESAGEARRLLNLRYRLSALAADEYVAAGFTTVVQDNIYGADVTAWLEAVRARPRHLVVLRPHPEVVAERDRVRRAATGKVAYQPGSFTPAGLNSRLADGPEHGLWLDTSALSPEDTVRTILSRSDEARID